MEKIKEYNPKIAVFNGKGIYEVFSGEKEFIFGKQPQKIADTDTVIISLRQYLNFPKQLCLSFCLSPLPLPPRVSGRVLPEISAESL